MLVDAPGNADCSHKGTCFEATGVAVVPGLVALAVVGTLAACAEGASCLEATAAVVLPDVAAVGNAGCSHKGTCLTGAVAVPGLVALAVTGTLAGAGGGCGLGATGVVAAPDALAAAVV